MIKLKQFIAIVGRRRFMIVVILLCIAAAIAAGWQLLLVPKNQELIVARDQVKGESDILATDIAELPHKYQLLTDNERKLEGLKSTGFFNDQDRIVARVKLDRLRIQAGLRGIDYNISPQEKVPVEGLDKVNKNLVKSRMMINFKGLTDLEMRDFIRKISKEFTGLLGLQGTEFQTQEVLDAKNLFKLSNQELIDFVSGKAEFNWYSLIDTAPAVANAAGQPVAGGQVQ